MKVKSVLMLSVCALSAIFGLGCGGSAKLTTPSTSASAAQPLPQNDDYISIYGQAASGADRQAIIELVKRYYKAAAADDGRAACALLYPTLAKAVPEDYGRPPGPPATRGKTCAIVLSKFFKRVPGQPVSSLATTKVTGVRVRGEHAFAQLSSTAIPTGEMSLLRQGRRWRVEALIGEGCRHCAAG